ncbi:helix-turn-helix transcriptional regulator [Embleya sp. NPDC005575]|uniref:helix-turn-helix domain-containing protein n=1 Tax=Embleya sp. NPDC005575 TaxID=3156892 RepID=UPI0033A0D0DC
MVGGVTRQRSPLELARDPESWPEADITDIAAAVVQTIARRLRTLMGQRDLSLRQTAIGSGVNRQTIANLLAGAAWPDVATVSRLEAFLGVALYPSFTAKAHVAHEDRPSRPRSVSDPGTTN